tara:strand:- start:96 stop:278 length:183 start_codon:yes stop_codon:yes gene_type:complete
VDAVDDAAIVRLICDLIAALDPLNLVLERDLIDRELKLAGVVLQCAREESLGEALAKKSS